jgi:hypothetical protein
MSHNWLVDLRASSLSFSLRSGSATPLVSLMELRSSLTPLFKRRSGPRTQFVRFTHSWSCGELNPVPSPCEGDVLPMDYNPLYRMYLRVIQPLIKISALGKEIVKFQLKHRVRRRKRRESRSRLWCGYLLWCEASHLVNLDHARIYVIIHPNTIFQGWRCRFRCEASYLSEMVHIMIWFIPY